MTSKKLPDGDTPTVSGAELHAAAPTTQSLVRTPAPKPTESLLGFLLRVSEVNGYDTPRRVLTNAGYTEGQTRSAGLDITGLATVLNRDPSELEPIAYCKAVGRDRPEYKILGHRLGNHLPKGLLRLFRPAFCPQCVEESGFIDAFWDLEAAVVCPRHGSRVLRCCPSCGERLQWLRPGLLTCKCGADLAAAVPEPVSTALREMMQILEAKFLGRSLRDVPNEVGFPLEQMEPLSLLSFLQLMGNLGRFHLLKKGRAPEKDSYLVMEAASQVLTDWPQGYYRFLDRLGTELSGGNLSASGYRKQFSMFYTSMFGRGLATEFVRILREEFLKFGCNSWGKALIDQKLFRDGDVERRFLSSTELARNLGISPVTLRRWCKKGLVPWTKIQLGRFPRYVIDADAKGLVRQQEGRVLRTREAAAYIEFPVSVLTALRDSGDFVAQYQSKYKMGFHEKDLEIFRRRILECCPEIDPAIASRGSTVSLEEILQRASFWKSGAKAKFVADFLSGKIRPVGRTGDSWSDILFVASEVSARVKDARASMVSGALCMTAAARLIGCSPTVIEALTELGYLERYEEVDGRGKGRGFLVRRGSVEGFAKRYIALARIAERENTSARRLTRVCRDSGIGILFVPRNSGGEMPFIERKQEEHLLEAVRRNPTRAERRRLAVQSRIPAVTKLRNYLGGLSDRGELLPRRARIPNKREIARASGIQRNAFYTEPELLEVLEAFDAEERAQQSIRKRDDLGDLRRYLESLRRNGQELPRGRKGRISRLAIAKACGINRNRLYDDPEAVALLERYVAAQMHGASGQRAQGSAVGQGRRGRTKPRGRGRLAASGQAGQARDPGLPKA